MGEISSASLDKGRLELLRKSVCLVAVRAGEILLAERDFLKVTIKSDNSPVTNADIASHEYLVPALTALLPVPVISEESADNTDIEAGALHWSIDPLDGTANFIEPGNKRFYVKITLFEGGVPILGVCYAPALDMTVSTCRDGDVFLESAGSDAEQVFSKRDPEPATKPLEKLICQLHGLKSDKLRAAFEVAAKHIKEKSGGLDISALSVNASANDLPLLVQLALGEDFDMRILAGKELNLRQSIGYPWDYGPDWLILHNLGGGLYDMMTGQLMIFNEPATRMNAAIGLKSRNYAALLLEKPKDALNILGKVDVDPK